MRSTNLIIFLSSTASPSSSRVNSIVYSRTRALSQLNKHSYTQIYSIIFCKEAKVQSNLKSMKPWLCFTCNPQKWSGRSNNWKSCLPANQAQKCSHSKIGLSMNDDDDPLNFLNKLYLSVLEWDMDGFNTKIFSSVCPYCQNSCLWLILTDWEPYV